MLVELEKVSIKQQQVDFFSSESNFAFGLSCDKNDKQKGRSIEDLLYIESKYASYIKNFDGTSKKIPTVVATNKCTRADF